MRTRPIASILNVMNLVVGDAFGEILRACWAAGGESGGAYEVIERDDGLIGVGDASRYFDPASRWGPLESRACERAAGRVLDVGCGAGRHAVVMAAAGLDVIGLDPSAGAVAVTRDRGVPAQLGSVTDPPYGLGTFDTFVMLGNNLGLLASRDRAPAVLSSLARLANPGARLYGGCLDPHATQDPAHIAYHQRNLELGRMPGQLQIRVRHKLLVTDWFDYLLVSPDELAGLVAGTPWALNDITVDGANYLAELVLNGAAS
jgi:SAM-dependent methyltransferase